MVWENVPGAFSSAKGEDFRAVLEETARVVDENAVIPRPPHGKWTNAGAIVADGWSIAWRVLDAQFWGVPQRRRRIALVADFGGQSAPEILFERESVSGNPAESGKSKQETSDRTGRNTNTPSARENTAIAYSFDSLASNSMKSSNPYSGCREVNISKTLDTTYPDPSKNQGGIAILDEAQHIYGVTYSIDRATFNQGANAKYNFEISDNGISSTLVAKGPSAVCYDVDFRNGKLNDTATPLQARMSNTVNAGEMIIYDAHGNGNGSTAPTLTGDHENRVIDYTAIVCCANSSGGDIAGTLDASYYKGVGARGGKDREFVAVVDHSAHRIVRRLTPLECERLQGFPDGWTDIGGYTDTHGKTKLTADNARYKALGNSIAIPPWTWVLSRLNNYCISHTMASLFDGIGGFPLIWERLNGKGSCLWSSEIEDFPIAVTRRHFGDEDR